MPMGGKWVIPYLGSSPVIVVQALDPFSLFPLLMVSYRRCKIVAIGDNDVGKSCLLYAMQTTKAVKYMYGPVLGLGFEFRCLVPLEYPISADTNEPAPRQWKGWHESWGKQSPMRLPRLNDMGLELLLMDTRTWKDYATRSRPLDYLNANVFCLCIAIDDPRSLQSAFEKWLPELRHFSPDTPIVIIGCKLDLRSEGPSDSLISFEQGVSMAKRIGAEAYMECSSKNLENVERVLQFLSWTGAQHLRSRTRDRCIIM